MVKKIRSDVVIISIFWFTIVVLNVCQGVK